MAAAGGPGGGKPALAVTQPPGPPRADPRRHRARGRPGPPPPRSTAREASDSSSPPRSETEAASRLGVRVPDRGRHAVAELLVELAQLVEGLPPLLTIHAQGRLERAGGP